MYQTPYAPPPKQGHKAWWNHFTLNPKPKKSDTAALEGPYKAEDNADHPVFGKPLKESLKYASVQISTANANGELYVWGYIPVVVAKCGLYLKENATEVPGTFRVSGSNKRMRELQAVFETPPRYGKSLDWKKESYTTHDVASVFRRYLTQMPEPVIPYDMYHLFRDAIAKEPFNQEEVIATYKSLIRRMPRPNQYLLLYVLDLLSVFARKSDKNLMTATNLAVIFRPGIISHPSHEMSPQEHALSQKVLEFLIAQQDWFMLDISPPTPPRHSESYEGGPSSSRGGNGGDAGGNGGQGGQGGQGQGGNGGRWRENTTSPSRQGTGDNNGTTSGGGGATPTQNAAWHSSMTTNAEAGPSRQRRLTLPDRSGSFPLQSSHPHTTAGGTHSHSLSQWSGSLAYAPPNSPSPQPHPQPHSQSQPHSQPQPPPQAPAQHRRQRSISHSPTRSAEKQAMLAIMAGHTYAQGPREPHPREPHQREAREVQQREPREPKEGQFSEHVWSNSSSLPPSPTSGSFPTGSNAVTTPSRHAKFPSAGTNANANGTSNANASASATPIYSRFSHPPQTTQAPTNGYEQSHGYGYGYGEHHQQRPMASASPSHHQHQSQSHSRLQTQNPYYHLPQGAQPPLHSSPPHSHSHQPTPHHRQPSPSHPPHAPFHAPIPTTNSDVDEHMIIPSSPSSPSPHPHERPSSPLSEDDVSIAPFGGEGGGLGGGWKLVRTPVPSPGVVEGKGMQNGNGNGTGNGGHGGFLALKVGIGRGKDKSKDGEREKEKGEKEREKERLKMMRRRTAVDPSELARRAAAAPQPQPNGYATYSTNPTSPLNPNPNASGATVTRSRTLPSSSRRKGRRGAPPPDINPNLYDHDRFTDDEEFEEIENVPLPLPLPLPLGVGKENLGLGGNEYNSSKEGVNGKGKKERRVLKKHRRASGQVGPPPNSAPVMMGTVSAVNTPVGTVALRS